MSKYILGNQKHLTLEDRILRMNQPKVLLLKISQHFFAKIRLQYPKKFERTVFPTGITKALSTMLKTSAFIVIIVKGPMPAEKYFFAVLNVLPVQPVIKPVKTSRKSGVEGWIRLRMYAMAVLRRSIIVLSLISIVMMLDLQTESIENC